MRKDFEFAAHSTALAPFRTELQDFLKASGFSQKTANDVNLAVGEALTNIIRHAYGGKKGKIQVSIEDRADHICIEIRDFGKRFDPATVPAPELPPKKPGGLGLYMIQTLMDRVEYDFNKPGQNCLRLTKFKAKK